MNTFHGRMLKSRGDINPFLTSNAKIVIYITMAVIAFFNPIFHCDAKPFALGPCVGLYPQCHDFSLGIQTCWYLKMLKFALPPMRTPNSCQWNIGCVGSPMQNIRVGHVHFFFFGVDFIRVGFFFQWNMGLRFVAAIPIFSCYIYRYMKRTYNYT